MNSPRINAVVPRTPGTRPASGSAFPRIEGLAPLQPLSEALNSPDEASQDHSKPEDLVLPPPTLNQGLDHPVTLDDEPEINISKLDRAPVYLTGISPL